MQRWRLCQGTALTPVGAKGKWGVGGLCGFVARVGGGLPKMLAQRAGSTALQPITPRRRGNR